MPTPLIGVQLGAHSLFDEGIAAPNALLTINIARSGCHGSRGPNFCTPPHYMKQFHPNYAAAEELQAALDKYEMESWEQLMELYNPSRLAAAGRERVACRATAAPARFARRPAAVAHPCRD